MDPTQLSATEASLTVPVGSNLACNATPPTDASVAAQVTATDTCSAVTTNVTPCVRYARACA